MKDQPENTKKNQKKFNNPLGNYARYSSIVIQMIVVIGGGIMGGRYLDRILHLPYPVITVVFSLLSVALAIYIAIKDFIKFK